MSTQPNDEKAQRGSPAERLLRARWTLAATLASAIVLAWFEPDRALVIFLGCAVIVAVTAVLPRRPARPPSLVARSVRRPVWPDVSSRALSDALPYPVYILDATGVLRYANLAAGPAFGPALIGEPASVTFRRPEVARLVAKALESGERQTMEYADQVPRERWFALSVAPIPRPAGGAPDFFLLSFMDQTEARRAAQMRSDFVANASHELRTPLASLRGFIETIQGPAANDPKARARFLGIMLDQAERMSRLIDDLLSLSRIEMKLHLRPTGTVDLVDVMGNVANALSPLAENLGVEIKLEAPDRPLVVAGDRDELIQVFENLVENACKYGQSGKRVEFTATMMAAASQGGPPRVEIVVRDHGPGISGEHLPRLTERFYRVDVGSSREKQGTGLGLAIVKHILNRHGVRLQVSSNVGDGARFSVIFSLQDDTALPKTSEKTL